MLRDPVRVKIHTPRAWGHTHRGMKCPGFPAQLPSHRGARAASLHPVPLPHPSGEGGAPRDPSVPADRYATSPPVSAPPAPGPVRSPGQPDGGDCRPSGSPGSPRDGLRQGARGERGSGHNLLPRPASGAEPGRAERPPATTGPCLRLRR